jgi:hypothetical protein
MVFSDSQAVLKRAQTDKMGPGQTLAKEIIAQATKLVESDIRVILRWAPSHIGIEGNEKADKIAKKAAENCLTVPENRYCSLSHITRLVKSRKLSETKEWLKDRMSKGKRLGNTNTNTYTLSEKIKVDPQIYAIRRPIAARFFQLKLWHAITAAYLFRIKKRDSKSCWWCGAANQDIDHLLFLCKKWRDERKELYQELRKQDIPVPTAAEQRPKDRLFNTPKALMALIQFISVTSIGCSANHRREEEERDERRDRWDIGLLEEEEERR